MPALQPYLRGLADEVGRLTAPVEGFDTLYWGGGTPSLLGPAGVVAVFSQLTALVDGGPPLREFTVECNPEHVDAELMRALCSLGVSRISLGVQSFYRPALEMLGRVHDAAQARRAIELAQAHGLAVSVDLIVGWPGQGRDTLEADLQHIEAAEVDHVSTYALTIEPDTAWVGLMRRGKRRDIDPDTQAERLLDVEQWLCSRGFEHYEISGYARPGRRAVHNQKYWNGIDYLGLGPSAASARFGALAHGGAVVRAQNPRGLATWALGTPPSEDRIEAGAALGEALWLGLRQLDGFDLAGLAARCGVTEHAVLERLAPSIRRGLVVSDAQRVRLAGRGWLTADTVAVELLSQDGA